MTDAYIQGDFYLSINDSLYDFWVHFQYQSMPLFTLHVRRRRRTRFFNIRHDVEAASLCLPSLSKHHATVRTTSESPFHFIPLAFHLP